MKKISFGFVAALFAAAVAFQLMPWSREARSEQRSAGLARKIPARLEGWNIRDEPLGLTERAQGSVKEILNYDEYIYRILRKNDREIGVYVAYWAPGRMPTRMIQLHTPDRCWTENGWACKEMEFGREIIMGDGALVPAQWRVFTPPGSTQPTYVLFWLLVSGRNYDFGDRLNIIPNPLRWWGQFIKELIFGYEEHYFIRLTSNRPFEEIQDDPGFQEILAALAKLGLRASIPAPRSSQ